MRACRLLIAIPALFAGAVLLAARPAAAATYYVSPTGSDENRGSEAAPFREIRRAVQSTSAGDTILVADGTYLGFDVDGKEGAALAPITIKAVGTGAVVLPTSDREDNRDTIFISSSAYVVVDGLRSYNANRAAARVDQSSHVTIRNCVFGTNARWGIFTDFSDDLLIEHNECFGSLSEHGIYISSSGDRPVVRGNSCHDNFGAGIQLNANVNNGGDGIITGALIENNVCFGNGAAGGGVLNLDGVQDSVVRNNLLFNNNQATGIVNYQDDGAAGPRGMVIIHNTVDQPATGRWCLSIADSTGPNLVSNNILYTRHAFRGSLEYGSAEDVQNTDSDYNVISRVTPDFDDTVLTLQEWQALGGEQHSIDAAATALWVNADGADYHLSRTSPAVDRGVPVDASTDLEGHFRPQGLAADLGCLEAPDFAPPAAPAGLAATAGSQEVALTWSPGMEPDLAGYLVYRATTRAGPFALQNPAPISSPGLSQTGLISGQTYWYYVTAVDGSGNESTPSPLVNATPTPPLKLLSLRFNPTWVPGQQPSTGTLTLTGPAPASGATVTLRSSSSRVAVPLQVLAPHGATTVTFTASTVKVSTSKKVTVTASYAGRSKRATLTVRRSAP